MYKIKVKRNLKDQCFPKGVWLPPWQEQFFWHRSVSCCKTLANLVPLGLWLGSKQTIYHFKGRKGTTGMLDKHSFHPTSLSHRQEIKAQRGCTTSPSKPASARAKRQTQNSGFLEAASLWTKLPELISLKFFTVPWPTLEFSQGLSERVVQKFAIQTQCSAG